MIFKVFCQKDGRSIKDGRYISSHPRKNASQEKKDEQSYLFHNEFYFDEKNKYEKRSGMWVEKIIKSFRKKENETLYLTCKSKVDYGVLVWRTQDIFYKKDLQNHCHFFIDDNGLHAVIKHIKCLNDAEFNIEREIIKVNCYFNDYLYRE